MSDAPDTLHAIIEMSDGTSIHCRVREVAGIWFAWTNHFGAITPGASGKTPRAALLALKDWIVSRNAQTPPGNNVDRTCVACGCLAVTSSTTPSWDVVCAGCRAAGDD